MRFPFGFWEKHLKPVKKTEIRCFYYLYNKVITIKNNSKIIINKGISLLLITNHHLSFIGNEKKGKASDFSNVSYTMIINKNKIDNMD